MTKLLKTRCTLAVLIILLGVLALPTYALDQWASSVIDFSSEYTYNGTVQTPATAAMSAPNSTGMWGSTGWCSSGENPAHLTLGYVVPVYATGCTVWEFYEYGAITSIEAVKTDGSRVEVWSGTDPLAGTPANGDPAAAIFTWTPTSFAVMGLRLNFGEPLMHQIDAVQLTGEPADVVVTPSFDPPGDEYVNAQTVTITSGTSGATIRYTTDGTTPSETNGTEIANGGTVTVSSSLTLKARAWKAGMEPSIIASASYTIGAQWANSVIGFSSEFSGTPATAALGEPNVTSGAWSGNGWCSSGENPAYLSLGFATPVLATGCTVREFYMFGAITSIDAIKLDDTLVQVWSGTDPLAGTANGSPAANAVFTWTQTTFAVKGLKLNFGAPEWHQIDAVLLAGAPAPATQAPTFAPDGGMYPTAQTVTITSATSGATIRYTTDGTTPSETNGTEIANGGTVTVSSSLTLKAKAWATGREPSSITSASYTIGAQWASSVIDFSSEFSGTPASAALGAPDATTGAWSNKGWCSSGENPAHLSLGFTTPVYATGCTVREFYFFGAITSIDAIKLDDTLVQVWSGTDPLTGTTAGDPPADAVFTWPQTTFAVKGLRLNFGAPEWHQIDAVLLAGVGGISVETPTFNPDGGMYADTQTVTISCATPGATIRYTTDGNDPTDTTGTVIANGGMVTISSSLTLKARATKAGMEPSLVKSASYTIGSQWASSVIGFSSQYTYNGVVQTPASAALGAPNVTGGAWSGNGWCSSGENPAYLSLGFATPVLATGCTVREFYFFGAITSIDAIKLDDTLVQVWSGTDPLAGTAAGSPAANAVFTWPQTAFAVKGLKLNFGAPEWHQIDAVLLTGIVPEPINLPVVGANNKAVLDALMDTAAPNYIWVLWGKVSNLNAQAGTFDIDDGSGVIIQISSSASEISSAEIVEGSYVAVRGTLDAGDTLTSQGITKYN